MANPAEPPANLYGIEVMNIRGQPIPLSAYEGKVLLIVNTASKCGFTPQYGGLQSLYEAYRDRGFEVLGFPCGQFLNQEPGDREEIQEFCAVNYGVTFPMFDKIKVNGSKEHPLYTYLKGQAQGALGLKAIKWNFTKFLIDREGRVVRRFGPSVEPQALAPEIEALLWRFGPPSDDVPRFKTKESSRCA